MFFFALYPNCLKSLVVTQSLSHVQLFVTPWTAACQASLPFTISWSLLKLMSIESVMPPNQSIFMNLEAVFKIVFFTNEVGALPSHMLLTVFLRDLLLERV